MSIKVKYVLIVKKDVYYDFFIEEDVLVGNELYFIISMLFYMEKVESLFVTIFCYGLMLFICVFFFYFILL